MAPPKRNALIITERGWREEQVTPDVGTLQSLVGGWLEGINPHSEFHVYCNEEGKLKGLPFNLLATMLVEASMPGWADPIVGTVVVLGPPRTGRRVTSRRGWWRR